MSSSSDCERLISTISQRLPISEVIEHIKNSFRERHLHDVQNILRENDMKMEIENLIRDRDLAKEEVCLLERNLNLAELERLKLDEKLQKSLRKCEGLEETITRLIKEKMESDKVAETYKVRFDNLSPKIRKMEEAYADMVTVKVEDLAGLVNNARKQLATSGEGGNLDLLNYKGQNDIPGNGGTAEDVVILSSKKGARASGTRLMSGEGRFSKIARPSSAAAGGIIEIVDSDDDTKPHGADGISNVGENAMNFVQSLLPSQRNRTDCMGDLFTNSTTKRRRNTCTSDGDNASIHEMGNGVSESSRDRIDHSSFRVGGGDGPACDSQTPLVRFNGLDDEVCTDSDESCTDSRMDDLIASIRSKD